VPKELAGGIACVIACPRTEIKLMTPSVLARVVCMGKERFGSERIGAVKVVFPSPPGVLVTLFRFSSTAGCLTRRYQVFFCRHPVLSFMEF
jgi:hypothetical protein